MKTPKKEMRAGSSADWLDRVQMSASDRATAKAYLRKTEAMFDVLASAAAAIRAAFRRKPVTSGMPVPRPVQRA